MSSPPLPEKARARAPFQLVITLLVVVVIGIDVVVVLIVVVDWLCLAQCASVCVRARAGAGAPALIFALVCRRSQAFTLANRARAHVVSSLRFVSAGGRRLQTRARSGVQHASARGARVYNPNRAAHALIG